MDSFQFIVRIFLCSCRQLQRGLGRLESQVERCCGDSEVCWVLVGECEGEVKRLGEERTHLLDRVKEIDTDIQRVGAPAFATLIITVVLLPAIPLHQQPLTTSLRTHTYTCQLTELSEALRWDAQVKLAASSVGQYTRTLREVNGVRVTLGLPPLLECDGSMQARERGSGDEKSVCAVVTR